ncbi:MAG: dockerin type I repeat-containing protein, partial [Oscillospiraceae bacterium]|nr:dockerin type I repeat-containing protein [Oscillospiraceae bacterium]
DLEVKVDHNFTWNIETDKLADIDIALRLSVTKVNVDPDKISKIEKSAGSINNADISFSTYAKNLGSGAVLSVRTSEISTTLTKMFANLYKTDVDGSLEFVAAAPIDENGYAALPIFDAATYIVITSTETKKPGDINNDCKVNMSDITMMLRKYVNSQSLSRATDFKMDYNNDGQCNMSDITALLRAYVDDKV